MEALYLPEKHMILCQCKSCKERIMSLSEWERHTGSRKKNWKMSVKLKITGEPLITLLDDIPGGNSSFLPQVLRKKSCYNCKQTLIVQSMLNEQLNVVLFVNGLKIGTTITRPKKPAGF